MFQASFGFFVDGLGNLKEFSVWFNLKLFYGLGGLVMFLPEGLWYPGVSGFDICRCWG